MTEHLPGKLIVFEGPDGAGKSELVRRLGSHLSAHTSFAPGGTATGAAIRTVLFHGADSPTPRAEPLLFAADIAETVDRIVRPALELGEIVLIDRWTLSTFIYQAMVRRSIPINELEHILRYATDGITPDLTIVLHANAEDLAERLAGEGRGEQNRYDTETMQFRQTVADNYLNERLYRAANFGGEGRTVVVSALGSRDDIFQQALALIENLD